MKNRELAMTKGLIIPDEALCKTCHNEKSPTFKGFNYAEMNAKIAHPNPAKQYSVEYLPYFIIFESPLVRSPGDFYISTDYEKNIEDFTHRRDCDCYRMQQPVG